MATVGRPCHRLGNDETQVGTRAHTQIHNGRRGREDLHRRVLVVQMQREHTHTRLSDLQVGENRSKGKEDLGVQIDGGALSQKSEPMKEGEAATSRLVVATAVIVVLIVVKIVIVNKATVGRVVNVLVTRGTH